jgi:hypothetical protein
MKTLLSSMGSVATFWAKAGNSWSWNRYYSTFET